MTVDELCNWLVYAQRQRVFCIKSQSRCDRSIESFIATLLGFKTDLTEAERKKLFKLAGTIRQKIEKAGPDFDYRQYGEQIAGVAPMILRSAEARAGWDVHRNDVEAKMKAVARELPGWPFVESVRGISELGLAVIVGEAGNLSNYANPAKIWKRFGLAVMDGYRQGMVPPGTQDRAAAWTERGYVPRRRAEIFVFVDDLLCRAQWRAEKTDDETGEVTGAHAIGPYGEIYARKKAEYVARADGPNKITAPDKADRRYMAKCFLADLHRAWKANSVVDVPVDRALFYRSQYEEAAE